VSVVSTSFSILYGVRQRVQNSSITGRGAFSSAFSSAFDSAPGTGTAGLEVQYDVRQQVYQFVSLLYGVRQKISPGKVLNIQYDVRQGVQKSFAVQYGVRVPVSPAKTVDVRYDVRSQVLNNLDVRYDTQISGTTQVSKSFQIIYATMATPSVDQLTTVPFRYVNEKFAVDLNTPLSSMLKNSGSTPPEVDVSNVRYQGAWSSSTVYAVGDLVTHSGDEMIATTAHTSGSVFGLTNWAVLSAKPGVFPVSWYGAVGDGTTDDTAAINAAVTAATTYALAGPYYAEVVFDPKVYLCSGSTTKTSTNKGNSQIPMPVVPVVGQKLTLVLRGVRDASAVPHWQQTSIQAGGAVIKSTLTGLTVDGTYGAPSVIGGPTPAQGYGQSDALFNNMLVVIDGLTVLVSSNPTIMGFDFSGMGEANITNATVNASTTPGNGLPTLPTHSWAYGVYMPQTRNNDNANIGNFSCEGMYTGLVLSEHAVVTSCRVVYCTTGILILGCSSDTVLINYASVEACVTTLQCVQVSGGLSASVRIDVLDVEDTNSSPFGVIATIDDPENFLSGEITLRRLSPTPTQGVDPVVNGATNVRIINLARRTGNITPPAVPLSTVAATKIYRDAAVTVSGGTVTAITVDGVNTGQTSGTVLVPSGRSITLTYSAPPTWVWTIL
jgi:hypothetical protein